MAKKYIDKWYNATIEQTHTGEHGTVHICTDDLIRGEAAERQKEVLSKMVYDILYYQAVRKSKERQNQLT